MNAGRHRNAPIAAVACLVALTGSACSSDLEVTTAQDSAVRVIAEGCAARPTLGGGSFVAPGHVLTVAHVVAGAERVTVTTADGETHVATVVAIDRDNDLAVLAVPSAHAPVLAIAPLAVGDVGTLVVTRRDHPAVLSFSALRHVDIKAADIDGTSRSLRRGYQIEAVIEHGDSGSVLVVDGRAGAVVFARSSTADNRAWATDVDEAMPLLQIVAHQSEPVPVDVGDCVGQA